MFYFRHVCVIVAERAIVRVSRDKLFYTKREKVLKVCGRTSQSGVNGMVHDVNRSQWAETRLFLIMLV